MFIPVRLLIIAVGIFFSLFVQAKTILSYEQRVILNFAIQSYGLDDSIKLNLLSEASDWALANAKVGSVKIKVSHFGEFLNHYQGHWPNEQSLEQDLLSIRLGPKRGIPLYVSDSPRVQGQIDRFIVQQQKNLLQNPEVQKFLRQLSGRPNIKYQLGRLLVAPTLSQDVNKEALATLFEVLNSPIEEGMSTALDQLKQIGTKVAIEGFAEQKDPLMKKLMQVLLSEYYSSLDLDAQKKIISDILLSDLDSSPLQKFEILVQNSGPQLQKLLQIVARQSDLDPAMKDVFSQLENSVKPVPWHRVEEILKAEHGNFKFVYFEKQALGVGTMAQVHRAKILVDGQRVDVVVRFLKPGIEKRVDEDHRILRKVAALLDSNQEFRSLGAPLLLPLIEDITNTVRAELDMDSTIRRQIYAKKVYEQQQLIELEIDKRVVEFKVPKLYLPKSESKLMVQEMLIGRKLDKAVQDWADLLPDLKRSLMEATARLWAQELIFGTGFFHSDLHQGNFLVNIKEPNIEIGILDFGMGGRISKRLQSKVIIFGAAIELKRPDLLAKSLYAIADRSENPIQLSSLQTAVAKRMELAILRKEKMGPEAWSAWATTVGLKLPYDFISLNRGIAILNKSLQESGSSKSFVALVRDLAYENPVSVVRALLSEKSLDVGDWAQLGFGEIQRKISEFKFLREIFTNTESEIKDSEATAESEAERSNPNEESAALRVNTCSGVLMD